MIKNFKLNKSELKLALTDSTSATLWTGFDYDKWFSKTFFESTAGKYFTKLIDVKSKTKVNKLDATVGTVVQDDDGAFTSSAAVISQKTIEVAPKKINLEIPIQVLEQSFVSSSLNPGSNAMPTTSEFLSYTMDFLGRLAHQELDVLTFSLSDTEGIMYKASGDSATIKVVGTTVTAANVIAELTKVYVAIPAALIGKPETTIFVASNVYYSYRVAFATTALSSGVYNGDLDNVSFLGVKIVEAKGMPANKMFAAETSNLTLALDLEGDEKNLQIIDMWNSTGVPSLRIASRFKWATDYIVSPEVVIYN